MSVVSILYRVRTAEIVLPAIQRDFVWPQYKILRLLDSIMRGYPIGTAVLWESYDDIQYRTFVRDFEPDVIHRYQDNPQKRKLNLVLDGQQRIQSLFAGLYGTLEGQSLYFDVMSGMEFDDVAHEKFLFTFSTSGEAEDFNAQVVEELEDLPDKTSKDMVYPYFMKVSDLLAIGDGERGPLVSQLTNLLSLTDEEQLRLDTNLRTFEENFKKDENLLKLSVVDENFESGSPKRKSESDVLEIFVRINWAGTARSRSDLIFSMMKLNWKESAQALPDFLSAVNAGNSFALDTDFVIRCLFAVSDLGTKFDVDILRSRSNLAKIRANFQQCCDAIMGAVEFAKRHCWLSSGRILGGASAFIPFVYYLYHTPGQRFNQEQIEDARKTLFLFAFSRPFARSADSRLAAFLRSELQPLVGSVEDGRFPINKAVSWVGYWERIRGCDEGLLQSNPVLALHVIQGMGGQPGKYVNYAPEADYKFPRSQLRTHGYDEALVNHFANMWVLPDGKGANRRNRHPAAHLEDVGDEYLEEALVERNLLDYPSYPAFINQRTERMVRKVRDRLQFTDDLFKPNV